MAISFSCVHCKKTIRVNERQAGKKGPCPYCRKPVVVPMQTTQPAAKVGSAELEALAMEVVAQKPAEQAGAVFVEFTCPFCDAQLKLPGDQAGRNAPCPECKRVVKVPHLAKTAPRDWRKPEAPTGPTGAKPSPDDGAWASQAAPAKVSRQALLDAKAIPIEREKWTLAQWIKRGTAAVIAVVLIGGGIYWYTGFRKGRLEDRALNISVKIAGEGQKGGWLPELQAQYQSYLGYFYFRTGKTDDKGRGAQVRLQLARQSAERVAEPSERIGVARELLPILIETNADTEDVGAVLSLMPPGPRELLLRELTLKLVRTPAGSQEADDTRFAKLRQIAQRAAPARQRTASASPKPDEKDKPKAPADTTSTQMDYADQAACLGVIGLELARLGQNERAREFANAALAILKGSESAPVPALALAKLLKLPVDEAGKDADLLQAAQVAAAARAGNINQALAALDQGLKGNSMLRLQTILDLAEVLVEQDQKADALKWLERAVPLLEGLRLEETLWLRQRILELTALAGNAGEAEQMVSKLLPPKSAADRARLEILRIKSASAAGPIDPEQCKPIAATSGAGTAAVYLTARHNARLNPADTLQWAETLEPEQARAFATLATAQSIAEQRK